MTQNHIQDALPVIFGSCPAWGSTIMGIIIHSFQLFPVETHLYLHELTVVFAQIHPQMPVESFAKKVAAFVTDVLSGGIILIAQIFKYSFPSARLDAKSRLCHDWRSCFFYFLKFQSVSRLP